MTRANLDLFSASMLVVLCGAWGLNQVAIKVANPEIPPFLQNGLRSLIACTLLYAWCRYRKIALFERDGTEIAGIAAGLCFGVEFLLLYPALDITNASRAVLFLYMSPFVVAIGVHFTVPGERLTVSRVIGLCAAFAGLLVVFGDKVSSDGQATWIGDAMCIVAAIAWGASTVIIKSTSLKTARAEKILFYQMAVAGILALTASLSFGEEVPHSVSAIPLAALLYQGVLVAFVSYTVWFWLIGQYHAASLTSFTFLTPLFGVFAGYLLLGEPLTINLLGALAMVIAGIILVNRPGAAPLTMGQGAAEEKTG